MADKISILAAIRDALQKLTIPSTKDNMDILLGCIQALDRMIQEEQSNAVQSDSE